MGKGINYVNSNRDRVLNCLKDERLADLLLAVDHIKEKHAAVTDFDISKRAAGLKYVNWPEEIPAVSRFTVGQLGDAQAVANAKAEDLPPEWWIKDNTVCPLFSGIFFSGNDRKRRNK